MKNLTLAGCCAARYYYDLGIAHGHPCPKTQDEFDKKIQDLGYYTVNICITNYQQTKIREYLKTQGWKEEKVGNLIVHIIGNNELFKYFREKKLKPKEQKPVQPKKKTIPIKTNVTYDDIYRILQPSNRILPVDRGTVFKAIRDKYGVNFPDNYYGFWRDPYLLRKAVAKRVAEKIRRESNTLGIVSDVA